MPRNTHLCWPSWDGEFGQRREKSLLSQIVHWFICSSGFAKFTYPVSDSMLKSGDTMSNTTELLKFRGGQSWLGTLSYVKCHFKARKQKVYWLKFGQRVLEGNSRWGKNINCVHAIDTPRDKHSKQSRSPYLLSSPLLLPGSHRRFHLAQWTFSGAQGTENDAVREDGVTGEKRPEPCFRRGRGFGWKEKGCWVIYNWQRCSTGVASLHGQGSCPWATRGMFQQVG